MNCVIFFPSPVPKLMRTPMPLSREPCHESLYRGQMEGNRNDPAAYLNPRSQTTGFGNYAVSRWIEEKASYLAVIITQLRSKESRSSQYAHTFVYRKTVFGPDTAQIQCSMTHVHHRNVNPLNKVRFKDESSHSRTQEWLALPFTSSVYWLDCPDRSIR